MYYEKTAGTWRTLRRHAAAAASIEKQPARREIERDRVLASHHLGQRRSRWPS
jgi:hypothetical protein